MRYFGQDAALLDGAWEAWKQAGLPTEQGSSAITAVDKPQLRTNETLTVSAARILTPGNHLTLVDARAPERYSGRVEPLDSIAGHIPGALNRPLDLNLDASGRFKKPEQLRSEFNALLDGRATESVVHYCGSGVTACHNAFAMELAGLGNSRVYPGSWSEWIRDSSRPIETSF
jgi:thiosulfate/3-mercaptopyruvate sulfurtransferase